jgi:hypothetical protein
VASITIDLGTLIALGAVVSLAGGAMVWAFRRVDDVSKVPQIHKALFGDEEAKDPILQRGLLQVMRNHLGQRSVGDALPELTFLELLKTVDRLENLVEGDTKEHVDQKKRDGVIGRLKDIEHRETSASNAAKLQAELDREAEEKIWRRIRAILRGLGVPSDLSKDDKLEKELKKRIAETRYPVDRLGAGIAMVDERPVTGPHGVLRLPTGEAPERDSWHGEPARHSPIERVPRPYIPREDDDE